MHQLQAMTLQSLLNNIKKIPVHCCPWYNTLSHRKSSNSLVDPMLCRVSYLFTLDSSLLYEIAFALCYPTLESEALQEHVIEGIIRYEYGDELIDVISSPFFT